MSDDTSFPLGPARPAPPQGSSREERLAAALRANLTRRKVQARARVSGADQAADNEADSGPEGSA